MDFSIWDTSAMYFLSSTSIKWGIHPTWYIGATTVEKVNEGVMISEFFLKLNAAKAKRLAEDPELTIKPNFFYT